MQGFTITANLDNNVDVDGDIDADADADPFPFPQNVHLFNPYGVYASRVSPNQLRFAAYGYLRPMSAASKEWHSLPDKDTTNIYGRHRSQRNERSNELEFQLKSNVPRDEQLISPFERSMWNHLEVICERNLLPLYGITADCDAWTQRIRWSGYRPQTPDSMPIVSEVHPKINGLYVNTGHSTYGFTHSAACAKFMANLIEGKLSEEEKEIQPLLAFDRFKLGHSIVAGVGIGKGDADTDIETEQQPQQELQLQST